MFGLDELATELVIEYTYVLFTPNDRLPSSLVKVLVYSGTGCVIKRCCGQVHKSGHNVVKPLEGVCTVLKACVQHSRSLNVA